MIFVTVGTHEQQFDRLIREIDRLLFKRILQESVFIQNGIKSIIPKNCESERLISYEKMIELTSNARIVITHGGPGSIFLPLSLNKIPIVVPRQKMYNEHVDDHQVYFSKKLVSESKVLAVFEIGTLEDKILNYSNYSNGLINNSTSNLKLFVHNLSVYVESLI